MLNDALSKAKKLVLLLLLHIPIQLVLCSCQSSCSGISIKYPFGTDDGCGSPDYRHMLECYKYDNGQKEGLFLRSPSAGDRWVRIRSIDYAAGTMLVFDQAGMSTCSYLQPASSGLPQLKSAFITPSAGNGLFLMNCSGDSPLAGKAICFQNSPGGHSCYELYQDCTSFQVLTAAATALPPCCFTTYDIVSNLSLQNDLKCSHYASVYDVSRLKEGESPALWPYGMKLSFSAPAGCEACRKSGGTCGYDVDTLGLTCICNPSVNATSECAPGSVPSKENIFWSSIAKIIYVVVGMLIAGWSGVCLAITLNINQIICCCSENTINHIKETSKKVKESMISTLKGSSSTSKSRSRR